MLAGCGTIEWAKPSEIDASVAKEAERYNRAECERNNVDATAMFACRQQNKSNCEQWRTQRDKAVKNNAAHGHPA